MQNRFTHQQKIVDDDPKKCGLFLGTGASKTRTALDLARGKTLVVCPRTQREDGNWERENDKWKCGVDLTVISKEKFRATSHLLPHFDTVIVDEAHTCLGVTPNTRQRKRVTIPKTSQLFEALDTFVRRTKPERLYLCTATILKSPMTVWGAARILGRTWDFTKFRDAFYTRLPMPGREVYVPKSSPEVKERLAKAVKGLGYVGRLSDYFDIPEQQYRDVYVGLTESQKKRLKEIPLEYPDAIVQLGKRLQIENGVLGNGAFLESEVFPNEKIEKILDYAIEFPRMIIFSRYISQIEQIKQALERQDKKVFVMTGDTKDRGSVIEQVNASDDYAFIVSSQISAGWEVPECPVLIFASMTYSIVDRLQGEGRILRANNLKKNLTITLITKGGVDAGVAKCIANKQDFHEAQFIEQA